jgi:hypothetical protein
MTDSIQGRWHRGDQLSCCARLLPEAALRRPCDPSLVTVRVDAYA